MSTLSALAPPAVPQSDDAPGSNDEAMTDEAIRPSPLCVPASEGAAYRYLAIDPALSCGFAVIQLNESAQIISIDVGVIEVDKALHTDGSRCVDLQDQFHALLDPPPDVVYSESFFAHDHQQGVGLNYKLRAALEMEAARRNIEYVEVRSQDWKKAVGCKTKAQQEKPAVKDAIERAMGFTFPTNLFIRGRWLQFRFDASDATGIAMWGVQQKHGQISFDTLRLSAPGLPKPRHGTCQEAEPPVATTPQGTSGSSSSSSGAGPSDETPMTFGSPSREPRFLPDPNQCTLAHGCTLPVNHTGSCRCADLGPRKKPRKL